MTRGELRAKVAVKLRIPPAGDSTLTEPVLNDMIELALRDVSSVSDWPWLITSAALTFATGVAPVPATMVKVRELTIGPTVQLRARYAELNEFLDLQGGNGGWVWTVIGTNIQLSPAPTTSPTNTLYFIRGEPDLTLDTQSPLIPEAHQAAVVSRAAYHAEISRGRADAAQFHNGTYEEDLVRMRDANKVRTGPRRIREPGYRLWATW